MMKMIAAMLLAPVMLLAEPKVEVLGEFTERPGNPAVGPDGTVYFSNHPFDAPEFKVIRLENGQGVPFPNEEVSRSFAAVIGIQADAQGRVWILDMGGPESSPKLVAWDVARDQLSRSYPLPKEVLVANSFVQDFALDEKRQQAYLADMTRGGMIDASEPAIIVIDLETGATRRLLQGHKTLQPEEGKTMITEGTPATFTDGEGKEHPLEIGLNPIAIDAQNEWVYFSTIHPGTIYRIPAALLADSGVSEEALVAAIEPFAEKPTSDGIAADGSGKVYITNLAESAISVADAEGTRIWIKDERFVWPDGVYMAPDGSLVATINQLNRAAPFNGGKDGAEPPYLIVRISE